MEIKLDRKTKIMEVALKLFAEEGFHNTSISKIAKQAAVSKGLMYNYFESKDELLKAVLVDTIDNMYVHLDANKDGVVTESEFLDFIDYLFKNVEERKVHWQLYTSLLLQKGIAEKLQTEMSSLGQQSIVLLFDFFKRCFGDNHYEELIIFSSLLKGMLIQYLANNEALTSDMFKRILVNFYKDRLRHCR